MGVFVRDTCAEAPAGCTPGTSLASLANDGSLGNCSSPGEFFADGCLAGQPLRVSAAVAITDGSLARIEKPQMARMLHEQHDVSELFVTHLLSVILRD
ncbi:MAG TPA: hypothetical protein VKM93_24755 [Terriglobia bacterium]|nr:hypothetical protein [Terriglobia bacterium]